MKFVKNTLFPHGVQEVVGSNPVAPAITTKWLGRFQQREYVFFRINEGGDKSGTYATGICYVLLQKRVMVHFCNLRETY